MYYLNNTISFIVMTKGLDLELPRVLTTNINIDLSRNRFEGNIPSIIKDIFGLCMLNLSQNCLEGHVPASLHHLSVLESLDLSSNKISVEISQQLASLKSLEVLNLSHNHLVGCISKGKQLINFRIVHTKEMMSYADSHSQKIVAVMKGYHKQQLHLG
uniref:Uncharacterized protein n=1 Tax=Solanum lycopersicum TaxID=4081 RepID=A0A3Q7EAX6_SOLLC